MYTWIVFCRESSSGLLIVHRITMNTQGKKILLPLWSFVIILALPPCVSSEYAAVTFSKLFDLNEARMVYKYISYATRAQQWTLYINYQSPENCLVFYVFFLPYIELISSYWHFPSPPFLYEI